MSKLSTDADRTLKKAKERAVTILIDSNVVLQECLKELQIARGLAEKAGLSVNSFIVKPSEYTTTDSAYNNNPAMFVGNNSTVAHGANYYPVDLNTGGHSNTDRKSNHLKIIKFCTTITTFLIETRTNLVFL